MDELIIIVSLKLVAESVEVQMYMPLRSALLCLYTSHIENFRNPSVSQYLAKIGLGASLSSGSLQRVTKSIV